MADDVQRQAQQQENEWDKGLDQRYGRLHLGSTTALLCCCPQANYDQVKAVVQIFEVKK